MSDIVERLRTCPWDEDIKEAADEIERLRRAVAAWQGIHEGAVAAMQADINRLRAALQKIVNNWGELHHKDLMQARAALGQPAQKEG